MLSFMFMKQKLIFITKIYTQEIYFYTEDNSFHVTFYIIIYIF